MSRTFLDTVERLVKEYNKPVMVAMISDAKELLDINMNHPMPIFTTPYSAAHALAISADYYQKKAMRDNRGIVDSNTNIIKEHMKYFDTILQENRDPLLHESIQFCQRVGVPIVNGTLIHSVDEIEKTEFLFPVAAKIVSPDAIHKTEVEGVKLTIVDKEQLKSVFEGMQRSLYEYNPNAQFGGVYVHTMAPSGTEFFVGAKKDPVFGPIVLAGLGGIYVELFKDVAIRLAPVTRVEALDMLHQLKAARLFEGFRGKEPLDANSLSDVIVRVSQIIALIDEITDIECNPVMVYPRGCMAVDARIFLQKQKVALPAS